MGKGRYGDDHKEGSDALAELITEVIAKRDAAQTSFWGVQRVSGEMVGTLTFLSLSIEMLKWDYLEDLSLKLVDLDHHMANIETELLVHRAQARGNIGTHGQQAVTFLRDEGQKAVTAVQHAKWAKAYNIFVGEMRTWVLGGRQGDIPTFEYKG